MEYQKALKLPPSNFKRLYGVSPETFWEMVKSVRDAKQGKRGIHAKLSIPNQILLTLEYWREYRTFFHIAQNWEIHESTALRTVQRIENILIKSQNFRLPGKRKLQENPNKRYYSGKKKSHTLKVQLIISLENREIVCTETERGQRHDFQIFKNSQTHIHQDIQVYADKGYQGIHRYHSQSIIPHKKPRKSQLTQQQKRENREQARERVGVENVIRCLKVFRILSSRYRNRRRRFRLRVNLLSGIYNYEIRAAQKS